MKTFEMLWNWQPQILKPWVVCARNLLPMDTESRLWRTRFLIVLRAFTITDPHLEWTFLLIKQKFCLTLLSNVSRFEHLDVTKPAGMVVITFNTHICKCGWKHERTQPLKAEPESVTCRRPLQEDHCGLNWLQIMSLKVVLQVKPTQVSDEV